MWEGRQSFKKFSYKAQETGCKLEEGVESFHKKADASANVTAEGKKVCLQVLSTEVGVGGAEGRGESSRWWSPPEELSGILAQLQRRRGSCSSAL